MLLSEQTANRLLSKKNVFKKNAKSHKELLPSDSRSILNDALYKTNLYGQSQPISRPKYWAVIRTAEKNRVVLEVNNNKDNVEIIGWRFMGENQLKGLERQAKREDGQLLILTPNNGAAAGLSTLPLGLSTDKVSDTSSPTQENEEFFRPEDRNAEWTEGINPELQEKCGKKNRYKLWQGKGKNDVDYAGVTGVRRCLLESAVLRVSLIIVSY